MENTTYESIRLHSEQQGEVVFYGRALGAASSEDEYHSNHPDEYASTKGTRVKCSACRWSETYLYETVEGDFVAQTFGKSIVPGETTFSRILRTSSAFELIEMLTVKRSTPYLPANTSRALAQAADRNDRIREAYINRAVV